MMASLPPLDCLRFFESAARHESFSRAAAELGVTPAAVAHRVRMLEKHLGDALFDRGQRSVSLNCRGRVYLGDMQRILADIRSVSERHRSRAQHRRLRIVSLEGLAERWLMPRLIRFKTANPDIAIRLETDCNNVNPGGRDFDFWLTHVAAAAPQLHRIPDTPIKDILFEEPFIAFSSPTLIETRGHPGTPADLLDWPLLYHLGREADWPYWFSRHDAATPDLTAGSGFRVYDMVIQAALGGLGVAVGYPSMIAGDIEQGALVPLFDPGGEVAMCYCLFTAPDPCARTEVRDFRTWMLHDTAADSTAHPHAVATGRRRPTVSARANPVEGR